MAITTTTDDRSLMIDQLTEGDYQAFLYDCDGTLADTMPAHKLTYIKVAADFGIKLDPAIIDELAGWSIPRVASEISARYNTPFDPDHFTTLKSDLFFKEYIDHVQPIEFVVEHLRRNAGKVKIAVVSGSNRQSVSRTLSVLGIDPLVEVLVCAGEASRGKPYPDPFLRAAELLGVAPEHCLVFEDGDPGEQAALAGGMKCIRIDKI